MHDENIKLNVRKQLKKQYPNWKRFGKKLKKEIAHKVLAEAKAKYDFEQTIDVPKEDLAFVDKLINDGIINRIFSYDGYRQSMRKLFPFNLFRAKLLKQYGRIPLTNIKGEKTALQRH